MNNRSKFIGVGFLVVLIIICAVSILLNRKDSASKSNEEFVNTGDFVGDQTCKSCHSDEFNHWKTSDHFMAMLPANDTTVLGDFDNATYTADGITSKFFKRAGKFYINTQDEKGDYKDYEIKYIFGHYPLQQYLVDFPGGRKQVTRQSWDVKNKKWFHQYQGDKIPAGDWLHWTGNAQNWNSTCADCHSTNLQKNYNIEKDDYHTTYSAINVSCESCHGAGKKHIDYIKTDFKNGDKIVGSYLKLTKNTSQNAMISTCAPCHSRRSVLSKNLMQTDEFLDNYVPELPTTEEFFADGQMKGEVFIYTSFMQSKMAQVGLSCNNCHNMHTGKTLLIGNALCMSCHEPKYNEFQHTRHAAKLAVNNCVSCHMPTRTYMGNDERHDHSFRVPRPDLSAKYATPNACNDCHKDKSFQWASAKVKEWYGDKRKYHFAEDLIPGSKLQANAEPHLMNLLNNQSSPAIVKASAAFYLSNFNDAQSLTALLACLKSKDAIIRHSALRSLKSFQEQQWIHEAMPLLNDKVRAVRIAAADLFLLTPSDRLSKDAQKHLQKAKQEFSDFLLLQADFPSGNLILGDYYTRLQDYSNAEKYYLRGIKKDNQMNLARLNLAVIYNLQGKNQQALQVLKDVIKIDLKNSRAYYNLALLYNELGNEKEALSAFDNAIKFKIQDPRAYYNYGLLLSQANHDHQSEVVLLSGLKQWSDDINLHYALTYIYLKQNKKSLAIKYAKFLKQNSPNNPDYQPIFQQLGL